MSQVERCDVFPESVHGHHSVTDCKEAPKMNVTQKGVSVSNSHTTISIPIVITTVQLSGYPGSGLVGRWVSETKHAANIAYGSTVLSVTKQRT